jgi:hypothetical protein
MMESGRCEPGLSIARRAARRGQIPLASGEFAVLFTPVAECAINTETELVEAERLSQGFITVTHL